MSSRRWRLRRLERLASRDVVIVTPETGDTTKAFARLDAVDQLFLARYDITLGRGVPYNPLMRAYLHASPEGRRAIEHVAKELDEGILDLARLSEGAELFEVEDLSQ